MGKHLTKIEGEIRKIVGDSSCREWHNSIIIEGRAKCWDEVIKAGRAASSRGYRGVVNKLEVEGLVMPGIKTPFIKDESLQGKNVDVLIIGGGIIGCSIARELSKWDISILLVDKEEDLAMHATSRNDGMVHPGIEPKPGSKKAYFNVRGNELYTKVSRELGVPLRRSGSTILYDRRWAKILIPFIKSRAWKNGVEGMTFISNKEARKYEPHITDDIAGAVHFASTAALSPYKLTIAYAENAIMNGAEVSLNTIVLSMERRGDRIISVRTNRGTVLPAIVINAAGVYADKIADMAGDQFFTIHPRKGQLVFLDKKKGSLVNSVVSKPSLTAMQENTKGGGIVKTIDGNILVGPDSYEQPFREDYSTNRENIDAILKKHLPVVPELSPEDIITYCAGTRAATYEEDFIIERSEYVKNLVYAAGIQSPGLASAPAIAGEIEKIACEVIKEIRDIRPKLNWNPFRKGIPELSKMRIEERNRYVKERPDYGVIICRCEGISRGEIIDAINSPIPAKSLDAVKRRVRTGMGRCQGGFCTPLVMEIIANQTGESMSSITKRGNLSSMVIEETKTIDTASGGEEYGKL